MRVILNGIEREIPDGMTISELLNYLDLAPERLAVERNYQIVRRADWEHVRIEEGDRVEIVHFVGGG
ncbi:MAG TPA: sulfur carrier protein ThiS [Blastocatellia bacterium]|nr:sulfur carrier protein ThiS [Blastocatellia bacterium]